MERRKIHGKSDIDLFLEKLSDDGVPTGNTVLLRQLKWDEKRYWSVHEALFKDGIIEKGRGYGGSVRKAKQQIQTPVPTSNVVAPDVQKKSQKTHLAAATVEIAGVEFTSELELYPHVLKQLQNQWAIRQQFANCLCEVTAQQGRRDTGGSWSRPDLTAIAFRNYEYIREKSFEIYSFEVKPSTDVTIKGVLEALAHREAATRSYVIYHTAGSAFSTFPEAERIEELAARHGIGVFVSLDVKDFNQWDEVISPVRANPDPEVLDTFIRRTLSDEAKAKLRRWF